MADNNKPLPKVKPDTEEPVQEQLDFGSMAEDFRSSEEIQKDLLTKIFNSIFDISKNVSIIAGMLPDLISLQSDIDKTSSRRVSDDVDKKPDDLEQQEKDRESTVQELKKSGVSVIKNTAEGVFGFFEKVFAILTPMIFGMLLAFTDLTNPIQLLKDALVGLAVFMGGKFAYQMVKALSMTLISKLLDRFLTGPKTIMAPGSTIITDGIGTGIPGSGGVSGPVNKRGRPVTAAAQYRYAEKYGAAQATKRFGSAPKVSTIPSILSPSNMEPMTTGGFSGGTGIPTAATRTSKAFGGIKSFGRGFLPLAIATSLISAPAMFAMKKEEGKSTVRAGTETGASVGGGLLGGVLAGGATGATLGAMGLNPFTVALGAAIGGIAGGIVGEQVASSFTEKVFNFFGGEPLGGEAKKGFLFSPEFAAMTPEQRSQIKISEEDYKEFNKIYGITPTSQIRTEELTRAQKETITAKEKAPPAVATPSISVSTGATSVINNNKYSRPLQAEESPMSRGLGSGYKSIFR